MRLPWRAFAAFVRHLPPDSATAEELDPEMSRWGTTWNTNALLAELFDVLTRINANLVAIASRQKAIMPKPYPRPWRKDKGNGDVKKYGKGALPATDLEAWFEEKRKKLREKNG